MDTVETILYIQDLLKLKGEKRALPIDVVERELKKIRRADFEFIKTEGNFHFYKEKNTADVYKVGDPDDIDIEETIRNNLWVVGIPAIGSRRSGYDNFLIKENRDPRYFANNIKNFTEEQSKNLEELWKAVIEYCIITGIPLNIERDNLWWDGERWLIYDTYPLFDKMFQFTLNLKNEKEYVNKLLNPNAVKETWNVAFAKNNGNILGLYPFEKDAFYIPIKEGRVEYPTEKVKLHVNAMRMLQKKDYPEYGVFYSRFVQMNEEVSDLIRSDINLSKAICSELPDCDNTRIIKEEIDTILELKKETEEYHKTLKKEDISVLRRYTEDKYINMNKCLREGTYTLDCDNETKYDIITMEKIIENGPRIKKDITVYRGIDPSDKQNSESIKVSEALSKLEPGDFWEDRGFVSTSSQHPPKSFIGKTCCIFQILLKAGTPAYYIGANSSAEEEEEIILLPGVLLLYLGKRTGDRGIKYKGSQNKIDVYIFECVKYDEDRFAISPSPIENKPPKFPFQPQDRKVDKNRLSLFNLTNMYNKYIPPKRDNLLRLMTWNLHEWRNGDSNYKKDDIIEKISDLNPDILALQEVTGEETGYSCVADMGSYGERLRNDLIVKKGLDVFLQTSVPLGHERCMVVVGVNLEKEEKLIVGNLHLDVSSAKNRLENITKAISEIESLANKNDVSNIIVLGDFNSYRKGDYNKSSLKDLENVKRGYYNSEEMKRIFETIRYIEDLGYKDTFHMLDVLHPANTNVYGGRIDFIFLSPSFNMDLIGAYSYYSDLSDHIAIIADIDLSPLDIKTPNAHIFNGDNKYENIKDVNLKNIKDEDLLKLCLNDPKFKELCRDDNFWKKRLIEKYGQKVAEMKMTFYKDKARTWKDFYLGIVYYVSKNGINRESIKKSYESGLWDITRYLAYEFYWKKAGDKDMLLKIASLTLDYAKINEYLKEEVDPIYGLLGAIEGKHETLINYFLNDTKIERWYAPFVSAAKIGDNKTLQKIYEKMLLTGKKDVLRDALHHGYVDALTKNHYETVALIKRFMEDNGISDK